MGLSGAYTGEDELDIIMDDVHDNIGVIAADEDNATGDAQSQLLGLWGAFIGAVFEAQRSVTATVRVADGVGPQTASMLMNIATQVNELHREFTESTTVTVQELQDAADPDADFTALGPVH